MFSRWDIDTLARTVYGEARGGGSAAMSNVASVIMNRLLHRWSSTITGVCRAPEQFSCWNIGDPNRAKIIYVTEKDPAFAEALQVAIDASLGRIVDRTLGADSYFAISIKPPYWAVLPAKHTITLWQHSFWRVRPATASGDSDADPLTS